MSRTPWGNIVCRCMVHFVFVFFCSGAVLCRLDWSHWSTSGHTSSVPVDATTIQSSHPPRVEEMSRPALQLCSVMRKDDWATRPRDCVCPLLHDESSSIDSILQ